MAQAVKLDVGALRSAIQEEYAEAAACPLKGYHFHVGRAHAARLGYDPADLGALPEPAVESFAGLGNPFALGRLQPGETVVEVGSGAGMDALIAARQVGPAGRVIGVDMTDAMLEKSRQNALLVGAANAEFRKGLAEELPVADGTADVVISNGVIHLCPDKEAAYREVFRVLKPGGRIQVVDTAVRTAVPEDAREEHRAPVRLSGRCSAGGGVGRDPAGGRLRAGPRRRRAGTRSGARPGSRPTRSSWAPSASPCRRPSRGRRRGHDGE